MSYQLDNVGNRTQRVNQQGTHSYAYDNLYRLTAATVGGTATTFAYRGDGLRNSRTMRGVTTTFTWDIAGGLPVVLDDGAQYVYGAGLVSQVSGANTYYYLADGLGSTMKTVDATGAVVNGYTYDIYGKKTSSTGSQANEFDFAGQQTDPTGLQYLRARYYDPETGTFVSREPMAVSPSWMGNPFGYGAGNPARYSDPTGLYPIDGSDGWAAGDWNPYYPDFPNGDYPGANDPLITHGGGSGASGGKVESVGARDFHTKLIGEYLYVVVNVASGLENVGGGPVKQIRHEQEIKVDNPRQFAENLFRSLTEGMNPKGYKGPNPYPGTQVQLKDGSIVGIRQASDGVWKVDVNSGQGYVKLTVKAK